MHIHQCREALKRGLRTVSTSELPEASKRLIGRFIEDCASEGLGEQRLVKYLYTLKAFAQRTKMDFGRIKADELKAAIKHFQDNDRLAPWTKRDYKVCVKKFIDWLKSNGMKDLPDISWISTTIKLNERRIPAANSLVKENEAMMAVDVADNPRDKAFIHLLYESGARIGEIGVLTVGAVKIEGGRCVISLPSGKTGARQISVMACTKLIAAWLKEHPFRHDPSAPLWTSFRKGNRMLKYHALRRIIRDSFKAAGITKRVYPHLLRHSRATFLAGEMTEAQLNYYLGWVQGSGMPATYIHLSGRDLDKTIERINGGKGDSTEKTFDYCPNCGNKLANECGSKLIIPSSNGIAGLLWKDKALPTGLARKPGHDADWMELKFMRELIAKHGEREHPLMITGPAGPWR